MQNYINEDVTVSNGFFKCLESLNFCESEAFECIKLKIKKHILLIRQLATHKDGTAFYHIYELHSALNDLIREVIKKPRDCNDAYINLISQLNQMLKNHIQQEE